MSVSAMLTMHSSDSVGALLRPQAELGRSSRLGVAELGAERRARISSTWKSSCENQWRQIPTVILLYFQGSTKTVSNRLRIVDFPVGQADFIIHLPNGQAWSMGSFDRRLNCRQVQNSFRQPEGQAKILIFIQL